MIKEVLDTNILISALFWKGTPYIIVQDGLEGVFEMVTSKAIMSETKEKLIQKFEFSVEDTLRYLELLVCKSFVVSPMVQHNVVKNDSTDNKILECAVSANADYIVTGDKHLLNIKHYQGITILTARRFDEILENERSRMRRNKR